MQNNNNHTYYLLESSYIRDLPDPRWVRVWRRSSMDKTQPEVGFIIAISTQDSSLVYQEEFITLSHLTRRYNRILKYLTERQDKRRLRLVKTTPVDTVGQA